MNTASISQLKSSPQKILRLAEDVPVAINNRQKTQAYLIGADLYHKLVEHLEDRHDRAIIVQTDFSQGKDITELETELGI